MGKIGKIIGIIVGIIVILVGGLIGWVEVSANFDHPSTPEPEIEASTDPEVIARGEYLVHNVAHCSTCHQAGEKLDHANPTLDRSAPLSGGLVFEAGPFGTYVASNITPDEKTGIGRYTDAQVARAIRHGVAPDGKLAAFMLLAVGPMSDEDLTAVISYLRAQKPVEATHPPEKFGFIAKALSGKFLPRLDPPPKHVPRAAEPSVARGEYLVDGPALCKGCHTPADPMQGFAFVGPDCSGAAEAEPDPASKDHEIIAPNLTPDPETGITGRWTEEQFVTRMKAGRSIAGSKMPWEAFSEMDDADLKSIYRYLKTLEPVKNDVGPNRRERGWSPE